MKKYITGTILILFILLSSCEDENAITKFDINYLDKHEYFTSFFQSSDTQELNWKASLGRLLFYDPQLSHSNTISCASCHLQNNGFADDKAFSIGLFGKEGNRNTPSLSNLGFQTRLFWDGSGKTINMEQEMLKPITNHKEMGMRSVDDLVRKLSEDDQYQKLFQLVYESEINEGNIGHSLTNFVNAIVSNNSAFDNNDFTANQREGFALFRTYCENCHGGSTYGGSSNSTGGASGFFNIGLDKDYEDEGAGDGVFKTPSLRNVALSAPYMHDGRYETLADVVEFYNSGVQNHESLDPFLKEGDNAKQLNLTELEKDQLVSFLQTFTDWDMVYDPKYSNPFD